MQTKIIELINQYDSIVIFGHKSPDGDCYGSQIGLKEIIKTRFPNKDVFATGTGLPNFYKAIAKMDNVSDEVIKKSLAIIVDANDLERMEDQRVYLAKAFCKFDHHVDSGTFTEGPFVVVENATSTCDIVAHFAIDNGWEINKIAASALYLGILTDSGRFQFVIDYPEVFSLMSKLCDCGAEPKKINKILSTIDESMLKTRRYLFTHYKESKNGVLYILFPKKDLDALGVNHQIVPSVINFIGNVKGHNVWAAFAEMETGQCKVEVRSDGPAVQPILLTIGGGGHKYAAGGTFDTFDIKQIENFVEILDNELANWKKEN